jgi:tRNA A58 N-methylase Trm61
MKHKTNADFFEFIDQVSRPYPIEYGLELYNVVKKQKPIVCYEFGSSWGFTTSIIAKALYDIGNRNAKLYSYDIDKERVLSANRLLEYLELNQISKVEVNDIFSLKSFTPDFDFLYIDIHNNGQRIQEVLNKIKPKNKLIYFEGGSDERNKVCLERKVPTFENLKYEVVFGKNKKHSFSKTI